MEELERRAREARQAAYAPYSDYAVGAAVRGADGRIWTGCNVENVSYGLCICAERAAIFAMVQGGCRELREVVVVTRDGGTPCGACLQVLLEFGDPDGVLVRTFNESGATGSFRLRELIPHGFRSTEVGRTER